MPTQVIRRPPRFSAVGSPVFYAFNTDDHVDTPGNNTFYQLLIQSVPPSGAQMVIEPYTFSFLTTANGYDPENPFHVLLDGATTSLDIAERLAAAVNNNAWLSDGLFAGTPVPISSSTNLNFSYPSPQSPQPFSALDPSGTAYTDPVADPMTTSVFVGNAAELRENFALHLELEIEQDYRQNTDWQRLPVLRLPTQELDGGQVLDFRIDRVIQARLGFDVPDPTSTLLTPALTAFRQVRVRYWPTWGRQDGGVIQIEELAGERYTFFALNAALDAYNVLPHKDATNGCANNTVLIPELLSPYFAPGIGELPRFLRPNVAKQLPFGGKDYLAFYANTEQIEFIPPSNPRLGASIVANGQTYRFTGNDAPFALLECEPEITFNEQIWLYPLEAFWQQLATRDDLEFDPQDITEICFYISADPNTAGANLITGGENGAFDTTMAGWRASNIFATIDTSAPQAGAGAIVLSNNTTDQIAFDFAHIAPIELLPNTTYTFMLYYFVAAPANDGLFGLDRLNWGLTDATIVSEERIVLTNTNTSWQAMEVVFTTGTHTTLSLALSGFADGMFVLALDSFTLQAIGDRQITQPACYTINPACEYETLLYRNRLGVAETLHFLAEPTERLSVERSSATLQPERLADYDNRDRGELNYANAPAFEWQLQSFPIAEGGRVFYEELVQSTAVYRLSTDTNGRQFWQPVVLTDERFTLFDPQQELQQLRIRIREAIQSPAVRA